MNAPRNVSYQAYLLESLKDPQEAAAYMDAALELEDPKVDPQVKTIFHPV